MLYRSGLRNCLENRLWDDESHGDRHLRHPPFFGTLVQSGEHSPVTREVTGSKPVGSAIFWVVSITDNIIGYELIDGGSIPSQPTVLFMLR